MKSERTQEIEQANSNTLEPKVELFLHRQDGFIEWTNILNINRHLLSRLGVQPVFLDKIFDTCYQLEQKAQQIVRSIAFVTYSPALLSHPHHEFWPWLTFGKILEGSSNLSLNKMDLLMPFNHQSSFPRRCLRRQPKISTCYCLMPGTGPSRIPAILRSQTPDMFCYYRTYNRISRD